MQPLKRKLYFDATTFDEAAPSSSPALREALIDEVAREVAREFPELTIAVGPEMLSTCSEAIGAKVLAWARTRAPQARERVEARMSFAHCRAHLIHAPSCAACVEAHAPAVVATEATDPSLTFQRPQRRKRERSKFVAPDGAPLADGLPPALSPAEIDAEVARLEAEADAQLRSMYAREEVQPDEAEQHARRTLRTRIGSVLVPPKLNEAVDETAEHVDETAEHVDEIAERQKEIALLEAEADAQIEAMRNP